MSSDSEFDSPNAGEFDASDPLGQYPAPLPPFGRAGAVEPFDASPSFMSELYAAAWTMARRDHELDRLFNPDFYQAGEI